MPRDFLASLDLRDASDRCRLDSLGFALLARLLSVLFLLGIPGVVQFDIASATPHRVWGATIEDAVLALALLAMAWFLWQVPKRVLATRDGLLLGKNKKTRLIPWPRVLDVRELPWIRTSPPWYPKRFQVDLQGDQRFDFVGRRDSREIVIQFVKRSEQS